MADEDVKKRRILYLEVGKHKFRVGENGVTVIEAAYPVARVWFEDGKATDIGAGAELMLWNHEEIKIIVPSLVLNESELRGKS